MGVSQTSNVRIARGQESPPRVVPAFLGFASYGAVIPGTTFDILARPQLPCQFSRLYVVAESMDFAIMDILIGCNSLFLSYGDVPAEAFGKHPLRGALLLTIKQVLESGRSDLVALPPGLGADFSDFGDVVPTTPSVLSHMNVMIRVENRGRDARRFAAVLFGEALNP